MSVSMVQGRITLTRMPSVWPHFARQADGEGVNGTLAGGVVHIPARTSQGGGHTGQVHNGAARTAVERAHSPYRFAGAHQLPITLVSNIRFRRATVIPSTRLATSTTPALLNRARSGPSWVSIWGMPLASICPNSLSRHRLRATNQWHKIGLRWLCADLLVASRSASLRQQPRKVNLSRPAQSPQ